MRRIGLTLLIVVAVVGAGASAHAAGSDVLNRRVSGAVSGVGTAEGAFPRCDISDVDFEPMLPGFFEVFENRFPGSCVCPARPLIDSS